MVYLSTFGNMYDKNSQNSFFYSIPIYFKYNMCSNDDTILTLVTRLLHRAKLLISVALILSCNLFLLMF